MPAVLRGPAGPRRRPCHLHLQAVSAPARPRRLPGPPGRRPQARHEKPLPEDARPEHLAAAHAPQARRQQRAPLVRRHHDPAPPRPAERRVAAPRRHEQGPPAHRLCAAAHARTASACRRQHPRADAAPQPRAGQARQGRQTAGHQPPAHARHALHAAPVRQAAPADAQARVRRHPQAVERSLGPARQDRPPCRLHRAHRQRPLCRRRRQRPGPANAAEEGSSHGPAPPAQRRRQAHQFPLLCRLAAHDAPHAHRTRRVENKARRRPQSGSPRTVTQSRHEPAANIPPQSYLRSAVQRNGHPPPRNPRRSTLPSYPTNPHLTPPDVPTILTLIHALADYEKSPSSVHATLDSLTRTLSHFDPASDPANPVFTPGFARTLLVTDPDGTIAGMALYFYNYSTWTGVPGIYLEDLFVQDAYRKKGYGVLLLKRLAQEVKKVGGERLEWSCLDWNEPSLQFYQSERIGAGRKDGWVGLRVEGDKLERLAASRGA